MANPKPGDDGYDEFRKKYNERRRKRRANPEYRAQERTRWRDQAAKRKAKEDNGNG